MPVRRKRDADLSADEILAELRRVAARRRRPLDSRDLRYGVLLGVWRWFGSMANARRAAGLPHPPLNHRWSADLVVEELRRRANAGLATTQRALRKAGRIDLIGAIWRYFRSIVRARRVARIPAPPPPILGERERWDAQRVVAEILTRDRAGKSLAFTEVPSKLQRAGMRYFGSWEEAIEAAGFDYDAIRLVRRAYTKAEIATALRRLAHDHPTLTVKIVYKQSYYERLKALFGSLDAALRHAGIEGWPRRLRERAYTRAEVIARLRARRRAGKPVYRWAVEADDHHLWYSADLRFGRWTKALAAARLTNDSPRREWTPELVLAAMRRRHRLGKSLKPADVQREDMGLYLAASRRFGSYLKAAKRIGATSWARKPWTRARVVAELRRTAGRALRISARQAGGKLAHACIRHFGSFAVACQAAGLETTRTKRRA